LFIVVGKAVKGDSSDGSNADSVSDDDDRFDEQEQKKKSTKKSHADSMYHQESDYWLKTNDPLSAVGRPFIKDFYDKDNRLCRSYQGLVTEWDGENYYRVEYEDEDAEQMSVAELQLIINSMFAV